MIVPSGSSAARKEMNPLKRSVNCIAAKNGVQWSDGLVSKAITVHVSVGERDLVEGGSLYERITALLLHESNSCCCSSVLMVVIPLSIIPFPSVYYERNAI